MPAKWSRPVFSFRFYEGKISRALIVIQHLAVSTARRHHASRLRSLMPAGLDDISDDRFPAELSRPDLRDRPIRRHPVRGADSVRDAGEIERAVAVFARASMVAWS